MQDLLATKLGASWLLSAKQEVVDSSQSVFALLNCSK